MNKTKHYFAFISHSTHDEKVALWLRDKLETYNIPTSVQNEVSIEYKGVKNLKPCFVYQTDLSGSDLNKALRRELTDSKFLIVICSQDSARSEYVNDEIKHFLEENSPERIIPYIIDGEPFAKNVEDECFPPALRELAEGASSDSTKEKIELRGINAKKYEKDLQDKKAPVVNVIATMLGVRFDSLWNRYRRKLRRKRIAIGVAICFAILLGFFYWDAETDRQIGQPLKGSTFGEVESASFSPDGKRIVLADRSNSIRIWDYQTLQELIDQTRERFKNRHLTPEERRKYYLE